MKILVQGMGDRKNLLPISSNWSGDREAGDGRDSLFCDTLILSTFFCSIKK